MTIEKIIFLEDKGNCRAPMAAALLSDAPLKQPVEVLSRGLVVLFPEPLNQKAEAVMIGNGLQVSDFMSKQFDPAEVTEYTLILTMDQKQREKALSLLPEEFPAEQVRILNEYVGEELEIVDPYGATLPVYGVLFESLNRTIKKLTEKLNEEKGE